MLSLSLATKQLLFFIRHHNPQRVAWGQHWSFLYMCLYGNAPVARLAGFGTKEIPCSHYFMVLFFAQFYFEELPSIVYGEKELLGPRRTLNWWGFSERPSRIPNVCSIAGHLYRLYYSRYAGRRVQTFPLAVTLRLLQPPALFFVFKPCAFVVGLSGDHMPLSGYSMV